MANHKSAKKRARQDQKRRARNRRINGGVKTAVKTARSAIAGEEGDAIEAARKAESTIRRAASKGIVSKKQASRRVSRLARAAASASSSS